MKTSTNKKHVPVSGNSTGASGLFDSLAALRDNLPEGSEPNPAPSPSGTKKPALTLAYERTGRRGKEATIICGLDNMDPGNIAALASTLKSRLATGGSARGAEILLQGDVRAKLRPILASLGYCVK